MAAEGVGDTLALGRMSDALAGLGVAAARCAGSCLAFTKVFYHVYHAGHWKKRALDGLQLASTLCEISSLMAAESVGDTLALGCMSDALAGLGVAAARCAGSCLVFTKVFYHASHAGDWKKRALDGLQLASTLCELSSLERHPVFGLARTEDRTFACRLGMSTVASTGHGSEVLAAVADHNCHTEDSSTAYTRYLRQPGLRAADCIGCMASLCILRKSKWEEISRDSACRWGELDHILDTVDRHRLHTMRRPLLWLARA
eukprot:s1085_g1.t1